MPETEKEWLVEAAVSLDQEGKDLGRKWGWRRGQDIQGSQLERSCAVGCQSQVRAGRSNACSDEE